MPAHDGPAAGKRIPSLSPGAAWLFRARSCADLERLPDPDVDLEDWASRAFDARQVRRYVDRLPARERLVLHLRYGFAGRALSCREVAEFAGMSLGAVHDIEHRALDRLRQWYRRDGLWPEEPDR